MGSNAAFEREARRRIWQGRIVAAFLRAGWRPPPMPDRAFDRIVNDIAGVQSEPMGWRPAPTLELSPAQHRALTLIAEGATDAEVAQALNVGLDTAKYHLKEAYVKLGARNRANAIALAFRLGLLQ